MDTHAIRQHHALRGSAAFKTLMDGSTPVPEECPKTESERCFNDYYSSFAGRYSLHPFCIDITNSNDLNDKKDIIVFRS